MIDKKKEYLIHLITDKLSQYHVLDKIESINFKHNVSFEQYRFNIYFTEEMTYHKNFYEYFEDDMELLLESILYRNSVFSSFKYKRRRLRIDIEDYSIPKFDTQMKAYYRDKIIDSLL